jgi:hypothetical protein
MEVILFMKNENWDLLLMMIRFQKVQNFINLPAGGKDLNISAPVSSQN